VRDGSKAFRGDDLTDLWDSALYERAGDLRCWIAIVDGVADVAGGASCHGRKGQGRQDTMQPGSAGVDARATVGGLVMQTRALVG